MKKTKKIVKQALQHPDLYSEGELAYFELWNRERKLQKRLKHKAKEHECQSHSTQPSKLGNETEATK